MDTNTKQVGNNDIRYVGFYLRFGALFIDSIVTLIIAYSSFSLFFIEKGYFWVYLLLQGIDILYKPLLEYKFGATLGKMIVGIRVVNTNFERINLRQSFKRSLLNLIPSILFLSTYLMYYNKFSNVDLNNIPNFTKLTATILPYSDMTINIISIIILKIEIIYFLWDEKTHRSAHDVMADTFVISNN